MSLAEPLGCVINAHSRLGVGLKDTVAVIGAGPIGVMHALVSRLAGRARKVYLLDTIAENRLEDRPPFRPRRLRRRQCPTELPP
jgi:L-iditol 2-dehydrogenase